MSKKIIAVNAGPRMGWNTETLIAEASRGVEAAGAAVERFNLFRQGQPVSCVPVPFSSPEEELTV